MKTFGVEEQFFLTSYGNQSSCKNQSSEKLESRDPTGIFFTSTKRNIVYAHAENSVFVETATRTTYSFSTEDTKGILTTPPA